MAFLFFFFFFYFRIFFLVLCVDMNRMPCFLTVTHGRESGGGGTRRYKQLRLRGHKTRMVGGSGPRRSDPHSRDSCSCSFPELEIQPSVSFWFVATQIHHLLIHLARPNRNFALNFLVDFRLRILPFFSCRLICQVTDVTRKLVVGRLRCCAHTCLEPKEQRVFDFALKVPRSFA